MNYTTRFIVVCALSGVLLFFGGCSKKSVDPYSTGQSGTEMTDGKPIDYSQGRGTITEELGPSEEPLESTVTGGETMGSLSINNDPTSEEYKSTYGRSSVQMIPVYFAFDRSTIKADQIPAMEHNAEYLKNNPAANVLIEGNGDERGTNEYNLALSERRALSAKNYLIELGIEDFRIRTVGYGEERPLYPGSNELDWAKNRRDDFIIE